MRKWAYLMVAVAFGALGACSSSDSNGSGGSGGDAGSAGTDRGGSQADGSTVTDSGGGNDGGAAGDGSTSDGGVTDFCASPPANNAPPINDMYSSMAMPAMGTATGGTIASGTFFMTAITNYESSASGGTHKDTMVIDASGAGGALGVSEVNGGKTKPTIGGAFTTSGDSLTLALQCPAAASQPLEYTYASGTLTLYDYNSKSVSVWTKQ